MLGSGVQIGVLTFSVFALALLGTYSPTNRGAIIASGIVLYALTASVAGYVSGYYYKMFGGTSWVRNVLLTAALFSGPLVATFSVLNTIAIAYRSTQALPFGTIVLMVLMWALVTFPLTILGGILAKNKQARTPSP
jgi:Endomembrane protein 70